MKELRHFVVPVFVCALLLPIQGCGGEAPQGPAISDPSKIKTPDDFLKEATAKDAPTAPAAK